MRPKSWFKITNKAADTIEIDVFDEIGAWGISAKQFVNDLRKAGEAKNIIINIDSPGGDCNEGFTMFDALVASQASITANITGLAASMASVIMLAAKTITIAENGRVMIHRVTACAGGNADDLDAAAAVMKKFEARIVQLYVARTGKTEAEILDFMKSQLGTWFFGQEAVDNGFADKVIKGAKAKAFQPTWARLFTVLPAALFDTTANPEPPPRPTDTLMTTAQKTRFRALLALAKRTAEEETELATLQALATKEGYDDADIKADNDADTIVALNARLATLEAHAKVAQDAADKLAKEKADAEAAAKDPAKLMARLDTIENLVKSGVLRNAGGTSPVGGTGEGEEGGKEAAPKTEAELRAAVNKAKTFEEKRALMNAFDAAKKK